MPRHVPLILARYSATGLIGPYCLISCCDHVVERLEQALVDVNVPVAMRHDVVAGAGLRFGRGCQLVFLALRGDVVDVDIDLILLAPFLAELIEGLVGAGNPMVPAAQSESAGGMDAADIRRGDCRCGTEGSGLENGTT